MQQEKRSTVVALTKPVKRQVSVDLPATETDVALKENLVIALDPELGVTLRKKGGRRVLAVSIEKLLEVAAGDSRKLPRNRAFLLGK